MEWGEEALEKDTVGHRLAMNGKIGKNGTESFTLRGREMAIFGGEE